MQLLFATNNKHKIYEVQSMLNSRFSIVSPAELGFTEDIPENAPTLEGNALEKARYMWAKLGINCFADDTGLEIDALNGEPGVYSARYAGEAKNSEDNMCKVLLNMQGISNRAARFRCVIALILNGTEYLFEGRVEGEILTAPQGTDGFGYDPIFRPINYDISFAEMGLDEKNRISHRGEAVRKLVDFLQTQ